MTVFKCSSYLTGTCLDNLLLEDSSSLLKKLVIRNMRGYSPLTLIQKLAKGSRQDLVQLAHLELDNLNLS